MVILSKLKSLFKNYKKVWVLGILFCLAALVAVGITQLRQPYPQLTVLPSLSAPAVATEPIQPIPLKLELDENKVELGDKLFHDPKLSTNDTVSCATCHLLDKGGTDRLIASKGMAGSNVGLNSPTVFNSGFHPKLNWDGGANTLEEQIDGPISKAKEMGGMSWSDIVNKLKSSPEYVALFREAYGEKINSDNIKSAIATFQRSLYTPNAPFDQYLRGDENAIPPVAKEGYGLFKSYGCVTCHQGMLVGGNMFQTLGIFDDYFADRGNVVKADLGRYNVTGDERDRHVFKVPSLRNITLTSPYLHDGNAKTLAEVIKIMGKYQLGVNIPQDDVDKIIMFLNTLTGEYKGKPL